MVSLTKRSIFYILGWLLIPFFIVDNFNDINLVLFIIFGVLFLVVILLNIRGVLGRVRFEENFIRIDGDYRFDEEEQLQKSYLVDYKHITKISFSTHDPVVNTINQPLVRGLRSDHLHRIKYGREPYQVMIFEMSNGSVAKLILNAFSKKQKNIIYDHLIEKGVSLQKPMEAVKPKSPYIFRKLWDIFTFAFIFTFLVQIIHARIFGGNATPIPEGYVVSNPDGFYLISQGIATEVSYQVWLTNYIFIWIAFLLLVTDTLLGILHLIQKSILKKRS